MINVYEQLSSLTCICIWLPTKLNRIGQPRIENLPEGKMMQGIDISYGTVVHREQETPPVAGTRETIVETNK